MKAQQKSRIGTVCGNLLATDKPTAPLFSCFHDSATKSGLQKEIPFARQICVPLEKAPTALVSVTGAGPAALL